MSDVSLILSQIDSGDPQATERLLPLVYNELRKLAAQKLAQERPGQTLEATASLEQHYWQRIASDTDARIAIGQDLAVEFPGNSYVFQHLPYNHRFSGPRPADLPPSVTPTSPHLRSETA